MSHFVTYVITKKDPEDLLAPYDENIEFSEYRVGEVSAEKKQRFLDYYKDYFKNTKPNKRFEELYAEFGEDWNDNQWKKFGKKWFEYSTYNQKSKWDWYTLGGRWDGDITTKTGQKVNECLLKDIDFTKTKMPFTIITPDGEWHEKREMLYFGVVKDEKKDWNKTAKKIINACLPDDTVYVYDLHI